MRRQRGNWEKTERGIGWIERREGFWRAFPWFSFLLHLWQDRRLEGIANTDRQQRAGKTKEILLDHELLSFVFHFSFFVLHGPSLGPINREGGSRSRFTSSSSFLCCGFSVVRGQNTIGEMASDRRNREMNGGINRISLSFFLYCCWVHYARARRFSPTTLSDLRVEGQLDRSWAVGLPAREWLRNRIERIGDWDSERRRLQAWFGGGWATLLSPLQEQQAEGEGQWVFHILFTS